MKIICEDKIIDLSKFETVRYRQSLMGEDYSVEVIRHETHGGLFGGIITVSEEIIRITHQEDAETLVKAITDKWVKDAKFFDVEKWKEDRWSEEKED